MKIVKRDGRIVEYNSDKIRIAIGKANEEVSDEGKAKNSEIESIIKYIEKLKKKRMLVEDIQDIIEEKLMKLGRYELAKQYIIYRYSRALVRKSNTTDETILSLIKNGNDMVSNGSVDTKIQIAATERDQIAGEVSKDLTRRLLLPEKISKAHDDGVIYFHNADYFLQPIFNSSLINIGDMLDNGTVMNGKLIESPNGFQVACTLLTQIIAIVASGQYGGQAIEVRHLGKYLRKSYYKHKQKLEEKHSGEISDAKIKELAQDRVKEELVSGVQTLQYQINTLMTTNGRIPFVTLFLSIDSNDEYAEENAKIIEEILHQRLVGMKDKNGNYISPGYPKLVYVISEENNLTGGKYDYLTRLAVNCSLERGYPDFVSAKKMKQFFKDNIFSPIGTSSFLAPWKEGKDKYKFEGRFNQGIVTLNLPQIGIVSKGNEDKFWHLLDERLDICFEALMARHYALLGTKSSISPIHWQYGGISRLAEGEKVDKLLKDGYSTISLGFLGLNEMVKLVQNVDITTDEGKHFAINVISKLQQKCDEWEKLTGLGFNLHATENTEIRESLATTDRQIYGSIKGITDNAYTGSYHIKAAENLTEKEKIQEEKEFQDLSLGGIISYSFKENENIEELINYIYNNVLYIKIEKDK